MNTAGVIPLGLWGLLKWSGSEAANILECWALYGYANLIWIPVALISWSPIDSKKTSSPTLLGPQREGKEEDANRSARTVLNYVFVGIGLAVSALFLFRNLYVLPPKALHHCSSHELGLQLYRANKGSDQTQRSYPIISTTPHQRAKLLLIAVVALHAGLAIAIKILFFAYVFTFASLPPIQAGLRKIRKNLTQSYRHKSPVAKKTTPAVPVVGDPVGGGGSGGGTGAGDSPGGVGGETGRLAMRMFGF